MKEYPNNTSTLINYEHFVNVNRDLVSFMGYF